MKHNRLFVWSSGVLTALWMSLCLPVFAQQPESAETPSAGTEAVQPKVDSAQAEEAAKQRERLVADAVAALEQTEKALTLLG
ncbi:MAG: hypothetical protein Kow0020_01460 [Wenzhouxiangellaceae bacterium]